LKALNERKKMLIKKVSGTTEKNAHEQTEGGFRPVRGTEREGKEKINF